VLSHIGGVADGIAVWSISVLIKDGSAFVPLRGKGFPARNGRAQKIIETNRMVTMNFLKNAFGILGALISIWGIFVILGSVGSQSEGAWVSRSGLGVVLGSIILIPGLIMLGIGWLIGRFVPKPNNAQIKEEVDHEQPLGSDENE